MRKYNLTTGPCIPQTHLRRPTARRRRLCSMASSPRRPSTMFPLRNIRLKEKFFSVSYPPCPCPYPAVAAVRAVSDQGLAGFWKAGIRREIGPLPARSLLARRGFVLPPNRETQRPSESLRAERCDWSPDRGGFEQVAIHDALGSDAPLVVCRVPTPQPNRTADADRCRAEGIHFRQTDAGRRAAASGRRAVHGRRPHLRCEMHPRCSSWFPGSCRGNG